MVLIAPQMKPEAYQEAKRAGVFDVISLPCRSTNLEWAIIWRSATSGIARRKCLELRRTADHGSNRRQRESPRTQFPRSSAELSDGCRFLICSFDLRWQTREVVKGRRRQLLYNHRHFMSGRSAAW